MLRCAKHQKIRKGREVLCALRLCVKSLLLKQESRISNTETQCLCVLVLKELDEVSDHEAGLAQLCKQ